MYAYITENGVVRELIDDIEGVSLPERYPQEFIGRLVQVSPGTVALEGYLYNNETGTFSAPPPDPPEPATPDDEAPIESDEPETYQDIVLRLNNENKRLTEVFDTLKKENATLEDCIVEMATLLYA